MAEVGRVAVCDPGALLPGGFWAAVSVWLERPQVANKRLWGVRLEGRRSVVLLRTEARGPGSGTGPEEERAAVGCGPDSGPGPSRHPLGGGPGPRPSADVAGSPGQPGLADVGEDDRPTSDLDSLWAEFSGSLAGDNRDLLAFLTGSGAEPRPGAQQGLDVVLRTVIPKTSPHRPLPAPKRELVLRDVAGGAVTFLPLEEDAEGGVKVRSGSAYRIQLGRVGGQWLAFPVIAPLGSCHSHSCEPWSHFGDQRWHSDGIVYPTLTWLREELLAKLARWSVEGRQSGFKRTLSLVSIDKYSRAYQELKKKYKDLVKVWPEVTNPEKFVYEDVAIAAYLLVLWAEERAERGVAAKQSFVDLGCGNGLLVHVLSSEGHPGRGIDVRRRKIWDMYGPQTCLEEDAITPNDRTLFPDVDWVIGNHSDELTPWIPVIAARSSYNCRFFVLPCCFFDFVGRYHRTQSQKTQYRGYLDFITEVGLTCGFHVEEDCLRIPSTKRVCLIGKYRTYPPAAEASVDAQRTQYIQRRGRCPESPPGRAPAPTAPEAAASGADRPAGHHDRHGTLDAGTEGLWLSRFRPREKAERVRNCAALPRDFVDHVVLQVASLLLGGKQLNPQSSHGTSLKTWNRGESLSLAEVAGKLDRETLQRLKRECGGLQTLLKNSHQVFEVLNGRVHIRDWRAEKLQEGKPPEARRSLLPGAFKTRLCWFFAHHPDGCVLPADRCPLCPRAGGAAATTCHQEEKAEPVSRPHRASEWSPAAQRPVVPVRRVPALALCRPAASSGPSLCCTSRGPSGRPRVHLRARSQVCPASFCPSTEFLRSCSPGRGGCTAMPARPTAPAAAAVLASPLPTSPWTLLPWVPVTLDPGKRNSWCASI